MKNSVQLTFILLIPLVFTDCTSPKYQKMQNERERRRAAVENERRKHDPRKMELALTDKLLGTWQFLEMEVDEGDVSEEIPALTYQPTGTSSAGIKVKMETRR